MINSKKKGFTIVELVIVIAVVAILAAVLIPTFSNLVKKANISADQQAVVQMNKLLTIDEVADPQPQNADEVVEVLIKNGYADDLTTYYSSYQLAWIKESNVIVLVENGEVVYPEKYEGATEFEELKPMIKNVEELLDSLQNGKTVFIGSDIETEGLSTDAAGTYYVNLNGNELSSSGRVGSWVEDAKLILSNGKITSEDPKVSLYVNNGGSAEINNVQIFAAPNANPIQCYGGTMVLNNVTTSQSGQAETSWYDSAVMVVNLIKKDENGTYYFAQKHATAIINSGMYSGAQAVMLCSPGGDITINGGTFVGTKYAIQADYNSNYASQGAKHNVTINGGTFNGNIKIANGVTCVINGGTFYNTGLTEETFKSYVKQGATVTVLLDGSYKVK